MLHRVIAVRRARNAVRAAVAAAVLSASTLAAQQPPPDTTPSGATTLAQADSSRFASFTRRASAWGFRRIPHVNAYNLWVGGSVATATSSDNRHIEGSMRMIAAQWTHDLFAWHRVRVSWVTEVLPLILVTSGAPAGRTPPALLDPRENPDSAQLARYLTHDSKGIGFSPLSAQAEVPLRSRLSVVVQVTSGVARFSNIVPYGQASRGNFTVSPNLTLQWDATASSRVAFGYTLQHTSNMTLAHANPGMNSHIFLARITTRRAR